MKREELEKLAELARIELRPEEEEKLQGDMENILSYFKELQELPTENIAPVAGGTSFSNVFREDMPGENMNGEAARMEFPETEDGFLKVPPVFSSEGGTSSGRE